MSEEALYSRCSVLSQFVLEGLSDPVMVLDDRGAVVDVNSGARRSLSQETFELFLAPSRPRVLNEFFETLAASGRASIELTRSAADGRTEQLSIEGFAVDSWRVVRLRDMTEQRALERELAQLRRSGSFGLMAATIIHDFNNLLTPILGWTTLLARELDQTSPAASLAADIESMAERAASLMREARSLAQQPRHAEPQMVQLNEVISGMRPLIERFFGSSMKLEFALKEGVGCVRVDRGRLEHALLNLLVNARNALPGPGEVRIGTSVVEVAPPEAARFVSLSVSDTGVGMTDEVRVRAFDEFFTTGAASGGTGLGLSSVKRFARESGGTVTLDSEPGRGTTVTLLLPRVPEDGWRDRARDGSEGA